MLCSHLIEKGDTSLTKKKVLRSYGHKREAPT